MRCPTLRPYSPLQVALALAPLTFAARPAPPQDDEVERISELDSAEEIVLHCQGGFRSAKALRQLRDAGFRKLWNLQGGILAWQKEVDPSLPRY